ncbi:PREDICTED: pre-mRNA-processing factor 17 isoform X2 [Nicrophorus vespilloides]|uniref:Pre-mRNA-processing factor 17 isoform X2 n=1 Tax=Nicrophorus vespilloides TaxID=110193 RepID=A0ABM1MQ08_NICVS|nr:PREDICTED: pre-mRNA-processing factor 17 isoform X2 [Nicrophorus vespilloides]
MLALQQYSSSEDENGDEEKQETLEEVNPEFSIKKSLVVCAAPLVLPTGSEECIQHIDPTAKEIEHNPRYEELFAPALGPANPYKTRQMKSDRNILSGYVEPAHLSAFQFENQRRTFNSYGYALDPTVGTSEETGDKVVGSAEMKDEAKGKTVFESTKLRPLDKRKRSKNDNPGDIDGFLGPWGGFVDEQRVMKPSEEEAAEMEELVSKRHKKGKPVEEKQIEEKTTLHIGDPVDYQGRSFLHAPHDVGVNLRTDTPPDKCFLPKTHIHTWSGHSKGIAAIRWFPKTAHLLLSASMDCRIKIWEVYNERRCIRTYFGHRQAVRDINFNNSGKHFLSAGYDRYIKLWDTETGHVISRFTSRKIPYCVKFNPDGNKQHLFVAGTSDKKIICWDTRSGDIVQEYDRHLGAVNSITFVDDNRRFVTTSDDKSLRVWEWDIPVDMKYIADPTMHSMPSVTPAPNGKWLACQSMDNKIVIFSALNRFKMNRKKTFTGHMVAGYACSLDFSPDMSYLVSGDADGKCYVWDWKTTKLYKKWKAHDNVCISTLWHPHEPSKMVSAGWDGLIKYWD